MPSLVVKFRRVQEDITRGKRQSSTVERLNKFSR